MIVRTDLTTRMAPEITGYITTHAVKSDLTLWKDRELTL